MSKVKIGLVYWMQIFLLPIYFLSFLIPRNRRIWLYGSTFGKRFADNPKYFYLYMSQHHKDEIRSIWITHDKDLAKRLMKKQYEAYYYHSFKGIYYSLVGGVYLYDNYTKDISFWLSGRAIKINLWHGIPLKKINMDNIYDKVRHPKTKYDIFKYWLRRLSDEKPSHYVLTTSEFLKDIFSSAFSTKKVIVAGYPRNDVLIFNKIEDVFQDEDTNISWIKKRKESGSKIILYMPTFRDSEIKLFDVLSFEDLDEFLSKNDMFLCIKAHPKSIINNKLLEMGVCNQYKCIKMLDGGADPYPILRLADKLITDYSSIYFDYLLLNRPIIFFPYDYKLYLDNSREMYFDYDEFTPGSKVYTIAELKKALLDNDDCKEVKSNLLNKVFDSPEKISSEILYNSIIKLCC